MGGLVMKGADDLVEGLSYGRQVTGVDVVVIELVS